MIVAMLLPSLGGGELVAQVIDDKGTVRPKMVLSYEYYDLACDVGPWEGYFAPQRWQRGINVEGKENSLASKGAVALQNERRTILLALLSNADQVWSIEVPTSGYLSFSLLPVQSASEKAFRIRINDRVESLNRRSDGFCYSPFLKAGDRFSLLIPSGDAEYYWNNLLFHSNYKAVIVRPAEVLPTRRYAPIEASLIQRVFFLSDRPGTWPVFDQDGDLTTTSDQFELRGDTQRFKVDYHDAVEEKNNVFSLSRTFTIREKCSRGSWLRSKRKWTVLPIIPE